MGDRLTGRLVRAIEDALCEAFPDRWFEFDTSLIGLRELDGKDRYQFSISIKFWGVGDTSLFSLWWSQQDGLHSLLLDSYKSDPEVVKLYQKVHHVFALLENKWPNMRLRGE